jgi:hypothetical protein
LLSTSEISAPAKPRGFFYPKNQREDPNIRPLKEENQRNRLRTAQKSEKRKGKIARGGLALCTIRHVLHFRYNVLRQCLDARHSVQASSPPNLKQ